MLIPLQWLHFAESTAFPPLGIVVWLTRYREESDAPAQLVEDARDRAASGLEFLERGLGDKTYVVGDDFTAADIMLGFTLVAAQVLGAEGAAEFEASGVKIVSITVVAKK